MARFADQNTGPSQRQLRVGELVRHALAEASDARRGCASRSSTGVLVSIAEVRMSPDLKHATALVAPLGGKDHGRLVAALNRKSAGCCAA